MTDLGARLAQLPPLQRAYLMMEQMQARLDADERARREPIAIIGVGCRFPGGANGPDEFWRVVRDKVDAIRTAPAGRWNGEAIAQVLHDLNPDIDGEVQAGFLQDVDAFDAAFFGISPREASCMDPQQRLLLEVAWEALEDAGQTRADLAGSRTGVFVGVHGQSNDYFWLQAADGRYVDAYTATGTALSVIAGRLSYLLDLHGPSIAVDTACSSSLVAVHQAIQSLRNGDCTMSVAGGVNLRLAPPFLYATSKMGTASTSGRCRAFDADADGIVFGEGCGVVVLRRFSDALAAGDPVWALVRGSAVNHDGRSAGLTAPSVESQRAVIQEALENAGLTAPEISLIEAHGTGTPLGDPIEIEALGEVFGLAGADGQQCFVGSVKTNIGHLEGAAGIAGLIKVVLALRNETIPPNLHFQSLNPHISLEGTPFAIPTTVVPWPATPHPHRAGVSSFGWSGTNAHVVLEAAPPPQLEQSVALDYYLLPLSARSPEALRALAASYLPLLDGQVDTPVLEDLCYTASVRRTHHEQRLVLMGGSRTELANPIRAFLDGDEDSRLRCSASALGRPGTPIPGTGTSTAPKTVFVFPGQGSQWAGMGRELLAREPVFRAALERCDETIGAETGWSILTALTSDESSSPERIDVIQPALFAIEVALAALWRSWGIVPDAVVGHSMGEVAAAHVAGILTLEDAVRVICRRSRLLRQLSGGGAMAMVELSLSQVQAAITGYEDCISVAAINSPRSTVLSGEPVALQKVVATLERDGVFCRRIKVDVASHSPQIDLLATDLLAELDGLRPQLDTVPFYSTVSDGEEKMLFDASYWLENLRRPVRFWQAIDHLLEDGHRCFVEISPHPIMGTMIEQGLHDTNRRAAVLPSLRRDGPERATLLGSLGELYALGHEIAWKNLYSGGGRCVRLPSYPWQRDRFWLPDAATTDALPSQPIPGIGAALCHPLLGRRVESSVQPGTHLWEVELSTRSLPYLASHRIDGLAVFPAAAYLEMALAGANDVFGHAVIEHTSLVKALVVPDEDTRRVQLAITSDGPRAASWQIASLDEAGANSSWTVHAWGGLRHGPAEVPGPERVAVDEIRSRCSEALSSDELYRDMAYQGIDYGPEFRCIERVWRRDGEAIASIKAPDSVAVQAPQYQIHPVLLDACLQVIAAATPHAAGLDDSATYMPVSVEQVQMLGRATSVLWSHAVVTVPPGSAGEIQADIELSDQSGRAIGYLRGLRVKQIETNAGKTARTDLDGCFYTLEWRSQPLPPGQSDIQAQSGTWLIVGHPKTLGAALAVQLEAHGEQPVLVSHGPRFRTLSTGRYEIDLTRAEDYQQVLAHVAQDGPTRVRGVIYLSGVEVVEPDHHGQVAPGTGPATGCLEVVHLLQMLAHASLREAPRLWLVTRGAQAVLGGTVAVAQAPLWGLGRTISYEHPELSCTLIDLDPRPEVDESVALYEEIWCECDEEQVALRGGTRYVARLVQHAHVHGAEGSPSKPLTKAGARPFRLEIGPPGVLDDLTLRATERCAPGPGEVEIEVCAAGLNFLDVLLALGVLPDDFPGADGANPRLGGEFAGRIVAVGADVTDLTTGQDVLGLAPWSFGRFVTTPSTRVVPKPAQLTFEDAATIPIAFTTAYHALYRVAQLARGERVLIHAAAGGVGLAAVQLAKLAGAEIFATAGSPQKRAFLQSLGVHHVMDSRSLSFADHVRAATKGEGIDVVLNSLTGAFIPASLELLRGHGRFLEIGKRDYYDDRRLGLRPFLRGLTFTLVDMLGDSLKRPAYFKSLLDEIVQRFETGELQPLVYRTFPVADVKDAFHLMAKAGHIGKIVVSLHNAEDVPIATDGASGINAGMTFATDETYLITGGLGALGLEVARWMAERGAGNLVLVGRGEGSPDAQVAIAAIRELGTRVVTRRANVAEIDAMAGVFEEIDRTLPPLLGVVHAAAVLDDAMLLQLTLERFNTVMTPKIAGAWNLHQLTRARDLRFFVLFSSTASLLGAPGQGNYAASNAFLDALSHERKAEGLPALSINWGPWADVGLASSAATRGRRLAQRGSMSLSVAQGLEALDRCLREAPAQVGVMHLNLRQWRQFYAKTAHSHLFDLLESDSTEGARSHSSLRAELLAAEPGARRAMLGEHVLDQLQHVLHIDRAKLDPHLPLNTLGFDSLMALELRNRLEVSLELTLPVTLVWGYPTVVALVPNLAARLELALDPAPNGGADTVRQSAKQKDTASLEGTLAALRELSDDDAVAALMGFGSQSEAS